jgi:hypothetical protein
MDKPIQKMEIGKGMQWDSDSLIKVSEKIHVHNLVMMDELDTFLLDGANYQEHR